MRTPLPRRALVLLAGGVVVLAVAAWVLVGARSPQGDRASDPRPAASAAPSAAPTQPGSADGTSTTAGGTQSGSVDTDPSVPGPAGAAPVAVPRSERPTRISVPSIGVDASMIDLGIADDGSIEVPTDPDQAGWLDTTPAPGQQGPAVVAGHVDSVTGPAVFAQLSTLQVGDEVVVTSRDGSTANFTVDGVQSYPQDDFPTASVYGPVPGPALRLITCGGAYIKSDGGYQDNVVVYAS